jgi:hypothetical protein
MNIAYNIVFNFDRALFEKGSEKYQKLAKNVGCETCKFQRFGENIKTIDFSSIFESANFDKKV